ncbi:MAG: hypothetical protein WC714_28420 [Candidatus Obscuribacterales bacterium]|jgi:uncharacterized protein YodC (DUF2158 family)
MGINKLIIGDIVSQQDDDELMVVVKIEKHTVECVWFDGEPFWDDVRYFSPNELVKRVAVFSFTEGRIIYEL